MKKATLTKDQIIELITPWIDVKLSAESDQDSYRLNHYGMSKDAFQQFVDAVEENLLEDEVWGWCHIRVKCKLLWLKWTEYSSGSSYPSKEGFIKNGDYRYMVQRCIKEMANLLVEYKNDDLILKTVELARELKECSISKELYEPVLTDKVFDAQVGQQITIPAPEHKTWTFTIRDIGPLKANGYRDYTVYEKRPESFLVFAFNEKSVCRIEQSYTLCQHCDHFVDENPDYHEGSGYARYVHLDDGDQEYDHNAQPGETHTMTEWKQLRPELFHPYADDRIGPNSQYHSQRGKSTVYIDEDGQ